MRDLAFALIWIASLPLAFISAQAGVLIWIWVALLSPNELLYGFMAGVPFNKIVAITTLGLIVFNRERKDFYLDTSLVLVFLFVTLAVVSNFTAITATGDGDDLMMKVVKEVVLAVLITGVSTTRTRIHMVIFVVVAALSFQSVKEGSISLLTVGGHKIVGSGSIGDNNSLATALLMAVPLVYYLMRFSAVRWLRLGLATVLGLTIVTVVMTYSRGGFIGLIVLALFMIKNSRRKFAPILLVLIAAVTIYAAAPASWFERLQTIDSADTDNSFLGRVVAWKISTLIALDHPILGGGMHAVQRYPVWAHYAPRIHVFDFIKTPPPDVNPHAAHSIYFELLGDLGFTGLFLFMTLMTVCLWNCFKVTRMTKGVAGLSWAYELARMLQITIVVYLVTGAALSMAYFEMVYIIVAVISRMRRTVEATLARKVAEDPLNAAARPSVVPAGRRPVLADVAMRQSRSVRPT